MHYAPSEFDYYGVNRNGLGTTIAQWGGLEIDGVPVRPVSGGNAHRMGMFSLKDDTKMCASDEGDHQFCFSGHQISSDNNKRSAIAQSICSAPTMTREDFADYDEMRRRSHP